MKHEAGTATEASASLRDRTRRFAMREILETALRLFTEQGFDETSVAQIAVEAGVSQRTLFRYFGTKEELLGKQDRYVGVLVEAISDQPAEADAWEALRAGVVAVQALHDSREQALARLRLLHSTASLRAGWLEKRLRLQEDLLSVVRGRMATMAPATEPAARAIIATAFACLDVASMTWVENNGRGDVMDLYDDCLAAVRG